MVKVAIAGGSGQVAREVIDALLALNKHQITILSRNKGPEMAPDSAMEWRVVDYADQKSLTDALCGVHTLLSFVQPLSDPSQTSQKNLIDAAIAAGVKRFAPSEYGSKGTDNMSWWEGKQHVRRYLEEVNQQQEVLEYTLFQPGLFLDYLAFPHKTAKHLDPLQSVFDFAHKRAMAVEGHEDAVMTLTTVADAAAVVARAVDHEGKWPRSGGIRGNRVTFSRMAEIGQRIRGPDFSVEKLKLEDLEAGVLKTSWNLEAVHSAVSEDQAAALLKAVSIGVLLSSVKGSWDVSDDWNQRIPDHAFTSVDEFLNQVWGGKP